MATLSASKRVKDVTIARPILYGTYAEPLTKRADDRTHRWTCYVKGFMGEDISYYVRKVIFRLHESFPNPNRIVEKFPFEIEESGWGEFEIQIKIIFIDPNEKPVVVNHPLRLYSTPDEDIAKAKPFRSETYDEIVFHEPTETMHNVLVANSHLSIPKKGSIKASQLSDMEKHDLNTFKDVRSKIQKEIYIFKDKYDFVTKEYDRLSAEVQVLEKRLQ